VIVGGFGLCVKVEYYGGVYAQDRSLSSYRETWPACRAHVVSCDYRSQGHIINGSYEWKLVMTSVTTSETTNIRHATTFSSSINWNRSSQSVDSVRSDSSKMHYIPHSICHAPPCVKVASRISRLDTPSDMTDHPPFLPAVSMTP